jgi:hypothetical protein
MMRNRQRQRAVNIVRCIKKRFVIDIIRSEKRMVNQLDKYFEFVKDPVFITYTNSKLIISDSLSLNQILKIEFDKIRIESQRGNLDFMAFNHELNCLFKSIDPLLDSQGF